MPIINPPTKLNIDKTNTLAILGDEITAQYYTANTGTNSPQYNANGFITWAQFVSNQRMTIVSSPATANATVTGSLLGQVQAAIQAKASSIFVMMGIHDLLNGVPLAQIKQAFLTALTIAASGGVKIFWSTLTPVSSPYTDASKALSYSILDLNRWIKQAAITSFSSQSVVLVDMYSICTVQSSSPIQTTSWLTNYSVNGITPINIGAMNMGNYLAGFFNSAVNSNFQLSVTDIDDIVNNPISKNVVSNSLFTIQSVQSVTLANNTGCTVTPTLTWSGGVVSSNLATEGTTNVAATISNTSGVLTITITNGGAYSTPPSLTLTGGTWSGTPATVQSVNVGPFKWGFDTKITPSMSSRSDGYGYDCTLNTAYPNFNYAARITFNAILFNGLHNFIAPDDNIQLSCAMTVGGSTDANVVAAPMIENFGNTNYISQACAPSGTDIAMSNYNSGATLTGTWLTPPWIPGTVGNSTYMYINCVNNSAGVSSTVGVCKVGRISCYIDPSYVPGVCSKSSIKWNPGHYVYVYPEYTYENFIAQDDFNTGSSRSPVGGETVVTTAAWRGVEAEFLWRDIEPTKGNYNWTYVDDWINGLSTFRNSSGTLMPRQLIAYIFADTYINPANYSIPDYILNDSSYGGISGATAGQFGVYPHQSGITSFTITNPGTYSSTSGVTVSVTGGNINGGSFTPVFSGTGPYTLSSITVNNPGAGIISTPTVTISGGSFTTQATATANWHATGWKLNYHNVNLQNRLIALAQAFAARYDSNQYFEALRFDETAVGDTFSGYFPGQNTNYVEGHLNIAIGANQAFQHTMVIKGFNYVADSNTVRFVRSLVEAGVGIGNVDAVASDSLLNAYLNGPYYQMEQVYKTIPIYVRVDGGNYMSNGTTPQPISTIWTLMQQLCGTHCSWNREFPTSNSVDYNSVTTYLNGLGNQAFWETPANYNTGLKTYKPLIVRR